MTEWLTDNAGWVQVLISIVTGLVWIFYLQGFLTSLRHQRRSMILISRGGSDRLDARCLVSNMGGEPIFLYRVIADAESDGETLTSQITDRDGLDKDSEHAPPEATNVGPLASGDFRDIGSFGDLLARLSHHLGRADDSPPPYRLTLTVVAGSGHAAPLVAARRSFAIGDVDGETRVIPDNQTTEQVTGWLGRRRLRRRVEALLAEERAHLD